jgi:hypothetical protein
MVVHDLDVKSVALMPPETDPPLIVDPNAKGSGTIALQRFKTVAGRPLQILQRACAVQIHQFAARDALDGPESVHSLIGKKPRRVSTPERPDHLQSG